MKMLIDLAKMAKIHKFGLANSLLDSPMATWLTITGTRNLNCIIGWSRLHVGDWLDLVITGLACKDIHSHNLRLFDGSS